MKRNNTVSAVIPTRRRPQSVLRAVRSVLAQKYDRPEVVVVVDGFDNATETALADVADKRLRVIVLPQSVGVSSARNLGVTAAWGDWIASPDDEDEWLPEKTTLQMEIAHNSAYQYPIVSSQLIAEHPATSWFGLVPCPSSRSANTCLPARVGRTARGCYPPVLCYSPRICTTKCHFKRAWSAIRIWIG